MIFGLELYGGDVPGQPVLDPAQMVDSPPRARRVSVDEAVEVLKQSAQAGLVDCTMNVKEDFWFICNCCSHACHNLRGITLLDVPMPWRPPATGRRSMRTSAMAGGLRGPLPGERHQDEREMVAEIDLERCLGCGVCTLACSPEALRLEKRDEHIFMPAADARELLVMRGASKGRPYSVHEHPHA